MLDFYSSNDYTKSIETLNVIRVRIKFMFILRKGSVLYD